MTNRINVLMVVEDEEDIRLLVRMQFSRDPMFDLDGDAVTIEQAVELAERHQPDLIVLDNRLDGPTTGLEGAPLLKRAAPHAKTILFTASEELRLPARAEPSIDAFLLKTRIDELLPVARRLLGLDAVADS